MAHTEQSYREAQQLLQEEWDTLQRKKAAEQKKIDNAQRKVEAERRQIEAELEAKLKEEAEVTIRQKRQEALKKAAAFRARPEPHKKMILLNRLGLPESPAFLAAEVRGAMSFGVTEPWVWQTAFFGGLIHEQAAEGRGWIATKFARAWMSYRFRIPPALEQDANNAIDDYLVALSAAGALVPCKNASFTIAVADLTCFETLRQIQADRSFDSSRFEWTPKEHWPSRTQVITLTEATVPNRGSAEELIHVVRKLPKYRDRTPMEICVWASRLGGGSKEAVAKYLVRKGFLRLTSSAD